MKGIILAGGKATRLRPLTKITSKQLLPVYNKPMIFYPIKTLVSAGIDEILVVTSGPYAGHFIGVLRNGKELGVKHLEYAYQANADGGIADALALAEDFAGKDPVTVILGDNTTDADISSYVEDFKGGATVFLKRLQNKSQIKRFGVAVFDDKNPKKIIRIEEKPKIPKSDYVITGLYIYDFHVYDHIRKLKPSERGEIEITDVNNAYLAKGNLNWVEFKGFWSDAGTFETLYKANTYWASRRGL